MNKRRPEFTGDCVQVEAIPCPSAVFMNTSISQHPSITQIPIVCRILAVLAHSVLIRRCVGISNVMPSRKSLSHRSANSAPRIASFKGYTNVPPNDESALMEAVALHGPVAVSIDAKHPEFKFYSEGVSGGGYVLITCSQ